METEIQKEAVKYMQLIIAPLLEAEDKLHFTVTNDEMGVLLTLKVAKQDMGKVIGKAGETIKSLRRLLRQWGTSRGAVISLKAEEPER